MKWSEIHHPSTRCKWSEVKCDVVFVAEGRQYYRTATLRLHALGALTLRINQIFKYHNTTCYSTASFPWCEWIVTALGREKLLMACTRTFIFSICAALRTSDFLFRIFWVRYLHIECEQSCLWTDIFFYGGNWEFVISMPCGSQIKATRIDNSLIHIQLKRSLGWGRDAASYWTSDDFSPILPLPLQGGQLTQGLWDPYFQPQHLCCAGDQLSQWLRVTLVWNHSMEYWSNYFPMVHSSGNVYGHQAYFSHDNQRKEIWSMHLPW